MRARDHDYYFGKLSERNALGKSLWQRAARATMNDWIKLRILRNLNEGIAERLAKFVAQAKVLRLVPPEDVLNIGRRRPNKDGLHTLRL